jgi:hypothetical protein
LDSDADTIHDPQPSSDLRARQYAVCTYALALDLHTDGAAAIFDQALTNGLAAIVARRWPHELTRDDGRVKSAAALLDVIERNGLPGDEGEVRLPHDGPDEMWVETPLDDEPFPHFTEVRVPVLRDAVERTQPVRHARADEEHPKLEHAHLEALERLDFDPALFSVSDEVIDRAEIRNEQDDANEMARAEAYWDAIGQDERERRRQEDYSAQYGRYHPDEGEVRVDECPVCWLTAFVADQFDIYVNEVGVGVCVACSYRRSQDVADQDGMMLAISRIR